MIKLRVSIVLAAVMLVGQPPAQAGIIEDLLALPAIQSLLNRVPELDPLVNRCGNAAYQQRNIDLCQQAAQAAQLAKMPPELRAVMATPHSAASLRQLCFAVQGQPAQSSYLCTELSKHDQTFDAQSRTMEHHRRVREGTGR